MKKIFNIIYNFVYVSINWNPIRAISATWHEIKRGRRYGIDTIKPEELKSLTIKDGDSSKSSPYEAVSYYLLEKIFAEFRNVSGDTRLTDLGSGKGRVMIVAAYYGFTHVKGIEFAKELCEEAEKNLKKVAEKFPNFRWQLFHRDVLNYELQPNDRVFFMFNPFNNEILEKFLQKIERSIGLAPRDIYFLYALPVHLDVLQKFDYGIICSINIGRKLKAVILKKS